MKITFLHVGLQLTFENNLYRVVRITENKIYHLEKEADLSLISRTKQEILDLIAEGKIILSGDEYYPHKKIDNALETDLVAFSEEQQKIITKRYAYVKQAEKRLGSSPTSVGLNEVISEVALLIDDLTPPSVSTLYRQWLNWYKSNHDLKSLANIKPGPKTRRKYNRVLSEIFHDVVKEVYFQRETNSKQDTYNALRSRLRSINTVSVEKINIISRSTFYRMLAELDQYEVMSAREGKKAADYCFRVTEKGVQTNYILERVEVDHTEADIMVVDPINGFVIGRPYITGLLDVHSRYLLGFEIGFEPPSELSVMRALRHAIWPKTNINEEFPEIKNKWEAYGIPSTLICDNALEFHSSQLRRMCMELNIELIFCPKKEPRYKGCVERFLSTINHSVCHKIRGTTYSNIVERGDYDSQGLACITLGELKELIYTWTIDVYGQDTHSTLMATPSSIWRKGLNEIEPLLPESKSALDLILTREYKRKLSHEGIRVAGLLYNSEVLRFMRIRSGNHAKVPIRVDLDNIGSIWVYDDFTGQYIQIPCTNFEYAEGLSWLQHKAILDQKRKDGQKSYDEESLLDAKEQLRVKLQNVYNEKKRPITKRKNAARLSTPEIRPYSSNKPAVQDTIPSFSEPISIPNFDILEHPEGEDSE